MIKYVVLICADVEWQVVKKIFSNPELLTSPYGEYFIDNELVYFQTGWGKIASAGATQYVINLWQPQLMINLGTCGGIEGQVKSEELLLINKTIVYDIIEQMGDQEEHIRHYSTEIDVSWLQGRYPQPVRVSHITSADRDLLSEEIPELIKKYQAIAVDWESGSIAWVAQQNNTPLLILRSVSDLVNEKSGEAYAGNIHVFEEKTNKIMHFLLQNLPSWLVRWEEYLLELDQQ
ncbi:MAG: 5'-methylthioadenosine/S-adenosylhomocysteine nucleosidase [Spirochaetes bacterium]|nr:5'-methylthioadenosine/S-adenosylhomocysteine nucleosidase [Spirochaetota bacterium]